MKTKTLCLSLTRGLCPHRTLCLLLLLSTFLLSCHRKPTSSTASSPKSIDILFLGHNSEHHNSALMMPLLASALAPKGIYFTYTADPDDLNPETLSKYDGLMIYANHDEITESQEQALLNYVADGHAFLPIHCASYCFRNSPEYVELVGAQFQSHGTDTFTVDIVEPAHPSIEGVQEFETWDETYVHHKHNPDRTVLMERTEGEHREPWTWVRDYGKGRVFYTAYGHDERTWNNSGFHTLIEKGILWAVGDTVKEEWAQFASTIPTLKYRPEDSIPNYEKRDPPLQFQLPLQAVESQKLLQIPLDFELQLFASEPDIINPITMAWDEKGRLWVVETVDYPNTVRKADGVGDDRIKICEDTDGDGKADKFTVFAENLNIPTSLVFVNGGVMVSQAPHFLFLQDTDGDDKADVRQTIISGWGTFDTHAGPSNLKYGLDNHIWGTVGYSGFKGEIAGKNYEFGQGVYRFPADVSDFEYVTRTSNNTWGLGFTETFEVFASTANNTHSVYVGIPNRYYQQVNGLEGQGSKKIDGHYAMHPITPNVRQVDVFGGFTAAAGHNFYTARAFPKNYWNRIAFVCEPTGGLVYQGITEEKGAGYTNKDGWNLIAGADEWFSPVHAEVGPDGAVWVLDWYNFIVQHNPTPRPDFGGYQAENGEGNAYINPLRDRSHGRVYRISYKNAPDYEPITLSKDEPEGLLAALKHDNMFWRTTAQRLLVERGETDVLPDLYQLVKEGRTDELGLSGPAVHALWTIHGLGALNGTNDEAYQVALNALQHPAAGVRRAALQVLPRTEYALMAMLYADSFNDPDLHTRLAAFLAASEMPASERVGKVIYKASRLAENAEDEWLSQAIFIAASTHPTGFLAAYEANAENVQTDTSSIAHNFATHYTVSTASAQSGGVVKNQLATDEETVDQTIHIQTIEHQMKYDIDQFTVEAGQTIEIIFENTDQMQHNLLIGQPGTLEQIGAAADQLARDPEGSDKQYVPEMEEVLVATKLLNPEETVRIRFTAPSEPGNYPYLCTFPGHWRLMQGTMEVVGANTSSINEKQ